MNEPLLDDIDHKDESYEKHLKGLKPLIIASVGIGGSCALIMNSMSPREFQNLLNLPSGTAEPIVFGAIGLAVVLGVFALYKIIRYYINKNNRF